MRNLPRACLLAKSSALLTWTHRKTRDARDVLIFADVCLDDEMGRVECPRNGGCGSNGMREYTVPLLYILH